MSEQGKMTGQSLNKARAAVREALRRPGPRPRDTVPEEPSGRPFARTNFAFEGVMPLPVLPAVQALAGRTEFLASEFLQLQGEDFVRGAYLGLFGRHADPEGLGYWTREVASGSASRIEVLRQLAAGPEAAPRGVRVWGLDALPAADQEGIGPMLRGANAPTLAFGRWIGKLPLVGRALRILRNIWQLPVRLQALGDKVAAHDRLLLDTHALAARTAQMAATQLQVSTMLRSHAQALEALAVKVSGSATRVQQQRFEGEVRNALAEGVRKAEFAAFQQDVEGRLDHKAAERIASVLSLRTEMDRKAGHIAALAARAQATAEEATRSAGLRADALQAALDENKARLEEAARAAGLRADALQAALDENYARDSQLLASFVSLDSRQAARDERERLDAALLASFYFRFEDSFRGSREEIKKRLTRYLAPLKKAAAPLGKPVLDIGCGRGEWLELVRQSGFQSRGVDLDASMVKACADSGLEVTNEDALEHLARCEPGSLSAVTGFHIIEHLPFTKVLELLDKALAALAPGGMALFETPNPENLTVGACNFYLDPTHRNPLPPQLMKYVLESRGFTQVEIQRVNPYSPDAQFKTGDPYLRNALNDALRSAQDYAVIGYKEKK